MQRGSNDSCINLACGLRTAFQQWLKGLSVTTFATLQELMIKDQFLYNYPTEVRQFVLDREPKTADQAAEIADSYAANRGFDTRRTTAPSWREGKPTGSSFQGNPRTTTPSWKAGRPAGPSSLESQRTRAPGPPGPKSSAVDTWRCYGCNKVGHLSIYCPERKSAPPNKPPGPGPSVLCASRNAGGLLDNLQPVTVGDKVTTGLRDTGAEVTLVRPELVGPENLIPGKIMAVKGVGGTNPAVPTACVYLDWGAGRGMREVGVTDAIPTNVLLGTDLGRLVAHYEPIFTPMGPTLPPVAPNCVKGLIDDSMPMEDPEEAPGMKDCVPEPVPNGSPEPESGVGVTNVLNCDVEYDALCVNMSRADTPTAAVTRSGRLYFTDRPLPTATEGPSAEGADPVESGPSEPSPEGSESSPPAMSLAFAADSTEFLEAVRLDSSLEELRGLAASWG